MTAAALRAGALALAVLCVVILGCRDPDAGVDETEVQPRGERTDPPEAPQTPTAAESPRTPSDRDPVTQRVQAVREPERSMPESASGYLVPDDEIAKIVDAPRMPGAWISPDRTLWLLVDRPPAPAIAELARPYVALAGMRIDETRQARRSHTHGTGLTLMDPVSGSTRPIALPERTAIEDLRWSPRSDRVAFSTVGETGLALHVLDVASGNVEEVLAEGELHAVFGAGFRWLVGEQGTPRLVVNLVVDTRRDDAAQLRENPPLIGPTVLETTTESAENRTYQDLLSNPYDGLRFEALATSQIAIVGTDGARSMIGEPGLHATIQTSPDGAWLLVRSFARPFSYVVPYYRFARRYAVYPVDGGPERVIASMPRAESVPIQGVPVGPRNMRWRPLEAATLTWVEALDGGDPKREVEHRDRLLELDAPFDGEPAEWWRLAERYRRLSWLETGAALVSEYDRDRKWITTHLVEDAQGRVLFDRSIRDKYGNPGSPVTRALPSGKRVGLVDDGHIYLSGAGASEEGEKPFLDRFALATGESERIYESAVAAWSPFVAFVSERPGANPRFVIRKESPSAPPQYALRDGRGDETVLTDFADPHPQLDGVKQEIIRYTRADGIELSGRLYRPPGVPDGEPVPTLVWAYPREHTDAGTAGQVDARPGRFVRLSGTSPLFFLTQGVAVFVANMPVVGDAENVNDTFVEQIVANAEATVETLVSRGIAQRDHIAVAGHSYGAFMVANLLAHTNLFRAGIARSGAYNRTLTPFGFQSERRTLWEAPEAYLAVSPLLSAAQIEEPLLLIHGQIDNNSGTWAIQSRRLYEALSGLGGEARLVILPNEGHGYRARESVLHVHAEQIAWFDAHVRTPRPPPVESGAEPIE